MAPRTIVEGLDVVGHVGHREVAASVDVLLDAFLLETAEERFGDCVVPAVPFRLILGSR